jgi:hypothetical protein
MRSRALRFHVNQAVGKFRRFYKATFRPRNAAELLQLRDGECNRCGRCCKILFRCPFLREDGDTYSCRIYGHHFASCKLFPLEPRDLEELGGECTYHFMDPQPRVTAPVTGLQNEPQERLWQIS